MIQLKITHLGHSAKMTFPVKYERVVLALWSIGLDHDPEKYTLRRLGAEFSFTTEEESHMVRLIDPGNTLMQALCLLSEMMYSPHPVAEKIHKKMAEGGYASEEDFLIEMESYIYDSDLHLQRYYFPVSGEVVDKRGLVRQAPDPLLVKYELLISEAIRGVFTS